VVWTSQKYHDYPDKFMGKTDPSVLNNAVFKLLKPGGTYLIIGHGAKAGHGLADTDTLHRIDPAIVRKEVEAAGFRFAGESKVLDNPADPLDIAGFDKSIRGHTSQFAYKFVKPNQAGSSSLLVASPAAATRARPRESCNAPLRRASAVGQSREMVILLSGLSFAAPFS